ncbi:hypothetical protein [Methylomusa anaerophila]|uniref:hypothetical protein n=1 Tax=Methylomusa anaerophila TaxID=1930071 RepID=UPI001E51CD84|nr:hypothetical protein [Methylomusa anaerophila]
MGKNSPSFTAVLFAESDPQAAERGECIPAGGGITAGVKMRVRQTGKNILRKRGHSIE